MSVAQIMTGEYDMSVKHTLYVLIGIAIVLAIWFFLLPGAAGQL